MTAVPSKFEVSNHADKRSEDRFSLELEKFAKLHQIEFLDLEELFLTSQQSHGPLFLAKDIHFSRSGNALVACALSRQLRPLFNSDDLCDEDSDPEISIARK